MSGFDTRRGQVPENAKIANPSDRNNDPTVKVSTTRTHAWDSRTEKQHFTQNGANQAAVATRQTPKFECVDNEDYASV